MEEEEVAATVPMQEFCAVQECCERFRAALRYIENPVRAMQIEAETEGRKLNGGMAILLADDPAHLRKIAHDALSS